MHGGKWKKVTGHQLKDMKVLLIGFGRIGRCVGKILDVIGAEILVFDPFLPDDEIPNNFTKVELNNGIKVADVISLHSSGEDLIIGEKEFNLMKKGVFILNAARGGLLNERELEKALNSGKVKGAWIDTFNKEPYTGSLNKYDQVILTPHIGSYTIEGRKKMELDAVQNLIQGLELYN